MPRTKTMGRAANGVGSIRKKSVQKNGKTYTYYEARATVGFDPGTGKQIQKSITGKTQKEVAQKLRQITTALDDGTYKAPSKLTVGEWLDIWTRDYLGGVKASTAYLYKKNVELYIAPRLGKIRLETLNAHTVQHFYNELVTPTDGKTNPLSAKTVKNIHGVFHQALQQAVLIGYLRVNPTDACTLPRIIKKEMHPLEEEQVAAFLKEVQGSPHEYLYKIALFTGLREGEVLGLGWEHIDLENGILTVKRQLRKEQKKGGQYYFSPPKNNRARSISLAPSVVLLFRLQKLAQNSMRMEAGDAWQENGLVFSNQTGGYLSYRTVYDCFKRIVKKIGSPATRFHDLRHTYAVACIKSGDDIKTVQENLGHATAAFTLDVYGHVTKQMKRDSAQRMEQFIQAVSAG
ncbi:MAG: site-specific integrase [Firmicutes bacterium]|nr:site-specific integrase [Bacillota bacterium]